MKNVLLILTALVVVLGCRSDDTVVPEEMLTELGTLYRYIDPGFVFSTCSYVFEAQDGKVYVITRDTSILRELSPEIDENEGLDLELTFRLTEKSEYAQCLHKREWLSDDTPYIWVESYR